MLKTDKTARSADHSSRLTKAGRRAAAMGAGGAIVLGASVLMYAATAQDTTQERAASAQRTLDQLVEQFANLEVISFAADVRTRFNEAPSPRVGADQTIEGSFEYEASGHMWRKASFLDPDAYPGMNTEIAYDGRWHQYHMRNSDVMSTSVGTDERLAGMCLPNPILLFAQFLVPVDDGGRDVLLRHVRAAASEWSPPPVEWTPVEASPTSAMRAVLPGAVSDGEPYDIHVIVPTEDDVAPIVMNMVREDGGLLMRSTFSDFVFLRPDAQTERWPTRAVFEVFDGSPDRQMGVMSMDLHDLRIGGAPPDASRYRLDWDAPSRVWFDEGRTFLK